jgi:hypothetical protein
VRHRVRDERLVEAAATALACARKLHQIRSPRPSPALLDESASALARAVSPGLALPTTAPSPVPLAVRSRLMTVAFAADRRLQRLLARPAAAPLRRAYGALRRAARPALR